jgi:hypothetical protein
MKKFVYLYPIIGNPPNPNDPGAINLLDNKSVTKFVELPVRRSCGVVGYLSDPCEGFNYNLCGIDSPYFQPVCVSYDKKPCEIPEGYSKISFKYVRLVQNQANVVLNLTSVDNPYIGQLGNNNPAYLSLVGFHMPIVDLFSNEPNDDIHGQKFAQLLSQGSNMYTEYVGDNIYNLYISIAWVERMFGIDICKERLKLVGPDGFLFSEVSTPACCELNTELLCPIEPGFVGIEFTVSPGNANAYSFSLTFDSIGCNLRPNYFRLNFSGSRNGSFDQAALDQSIISQIPAQRAGIKIEQKGPGKFLLKISQAYLLYNYRWDDGVDSISFCNYSVLVCDIRNVVVNAQSTLLCCNRVNANSCAGLPNFLRFSYTIEESNYNMPQPIQPGAMNGNGVHVYIPGITVVNESNFSDNLANSAEYMAMWVPNNATYEQYLDYVESRWQWLFQGSAIGKGFVRRIGNRFDIFIDRNVYRNSVFPVGQTDCDTRIFVYQLRSLNIHQPFITTIDFKTRINTGEPESLRGELPYQLGNTPLKLSYVGSSSKGICCPKLEELPDCCPCSEYTLCSTVGLLNSRLQDYIMSLPLNTGQSVIEVYPRMTGDRLLETLKRSFAELLDIEYENECYYLNITSKENKHVSNKDLDTVIIETALYPKTNCNYSYVGAVFIQKLNGRLHTAATISISTSKGAVIPRRLHDYVEGRWSRPFGFTESASVCAPDPDCREEDNTFKEDCVKCKEVCQETDLLYFQFQMPDNYNRWSDDANNAYYSNICTSEDYCWVDRSVANQQDSKWFATVEVISNGSIQNIHFDEFVNRSFVGYLGDGRFVQQIAIDPTALPDSFYFRFRFKGGEKEVVVYTEPYMKVGCQDTLVLEGVYPDTGKASIDCLGNTYEIPRQYIGSVYKHKLKMRIPGVINYDSFEIKSTQTNNRTIKTSTSANYKIRTMPLPPYVAERIKTILESQYIYVNGEEYAFDGNVSRSNNDGSMWLMEITLSKVDRSCSQINFSCIS